MPRKLNKKTAKKSIIKKRVTRRSTRSKGSLVDDTQRFALIRSAKAFGSSVLLQDLQDPTLMQIPEEVGLKYFGPQDIGIIEAKNKGGTVTYVETTNAVIYLSDNGYAGRTLKDVS